MRSVTTTETETYDAPGGGQRRRRVVLAMKVEDSSERSHVLAP